MLAFLSTVVTLIVLVLFNLLEVYIDKVHHDKLFIIVFTNADYGNLDVVLEIIKTNQLASRTVQISKVDGCLQTALLVTGHRKNISQLNQVLLQMPVIKSF